MSTGASAVPDLLLERLAQGELSAAERAALDARIARDPEARARLEALAISNAEILAAHPPAEMARRIEAGLTTKRAWSLRRWQLACACALPVAVAAILAVVVLPDGTPPSGLGPGSGEVTRVKGLVPALAGHRKTGDRSERLDEGAPARPGDVLQLSYQAAGRPHGVIVSIDGRGAVTLHHPPAPGGDTALLAGGEAALPHAYELDDAPGFERFFFVTTPSTETPATVQQVLEAANTLAADPARARRAPLPLPRGWEQTAVTVVKATPEPTP